MKKLDLEITIHQDISPIENSLGEKIGTSSRYIARLSPLDHYGVGITPQMALFYLLVEWKKAEEKKVKKKA